MALEKEPRISQSPRMNDRIAWLSLGALLAGSAVADGAGLTLSREKNWLIVHGAQIPGEAIRINYLEAYCRANSTDADWVKHTMIHHANEMISDDKKVM